MTVTGPRMAQDKIGGLSRPNHRAPLEPATGHLRAVVGVRHIVAGVAIIPVNPHMFLWTNPVFNWRLKMILLIKERKLNEDGHLPGGGPCKKEIVPAGTIVYDIFHPRYKVYFWACYLGKAQAERVALALEDPKNTRGGQPFSQIDRAANFRSERPVRISRRKD